MRQGLAIISSPLPLTTPQVPPSRNAGGKSADEVGEMFSRVSRRYDFLNHLLSLGLDILWRKRAAREVRPGGKVLVLEFTKPRGFFFGPLYMFYFKHILPALGRCVAAAAGDAYKYLPQSVQAFAGPEEMSEKMRALGLLNVRAIAMT